MGNCMETYTIGQQDQKQQQEEEEEEERGRWRGKNGLSMKIVLTKEELKWLMLEINEKGGMSLDQMLAEIQRGRQRVQGWKPSLESILEAPEILDMDTTSSFS